MKSKTSLDTHKDKNTHIHSRARPNETKDHHRPHILPQNLINNPVTQFQQTLNGDACHLETTLIHSEHIKTCKPAGPLRHGKEEYRWMSWI